MKKTLTSIALLAGAVSGYSQGGSMIFAAYDTGLKQQIFNVQSSAPTQGSPTAEYLSYTVGATTYTMTTPEYLGSTTATKETPQGTVNFTSPLSGSGYSFEALISTAGGSEPLSALSPIGTVGTFYSTPAAAIGFGKGAQTLNPTAGTTVTVAIAAWNNEGGTVTSLAEAVADNDPWGISNTGNVVLATGAETVPFMPTNIQGFSLGVAGVPEPSTIALGVMGASALLFRRRK